MLRVPRVRLNYNTSKYTPTATHTSLFFIAKATQVSLTSYPMFEDISQTMNVMAETNEYVCTIGGASSVSIVLISYRISVEIAEKSMSMVVKGRERRGSGERVEKSSPPIK